MNNYEAALIGWAALSVWAFICHLFNTDPAEALVSVIGIICLVIFIGSASFFLCAFVGRLVTGNL